MTYSASSPILGSGQASASQIDAFMRARGRALAADYAPDGQYQEPPPLGEIIRSEAARYANTELNHDLIAGQIADELSPGNEEPMMAMAIRAAPMSDMRAFAAPPGLFVVHKPILHDRRWHDLLQGDCYSVNRTGNSRPN